MSENIKQIVSRKCGITHEYGSSKIDYVPAKNFNQTWGAYFDSIWSLFLKKHTYGSSTVYTAAEVWQFYNDVFYRETGKINHFLYELPLIHTVYLKQKFPNMFGKLKYWPVKTTIAKLVNQQFTLLQNALLKTRRTDEYKVKEKVETKKPNGQIELVEQEVTKTRNVYLEEHIQKFEFHVSQYGELLGSVWDYNPVRDDKNITNDAVDTALRCYSEHLESEKKYVSPKSGLSEKELYKWANEKFNLGLVY